ncbi:MAG: sigma-70 family RNA polymerase sigma factor [Kineosporiaceae bacterium]|nr:sigma-70 family RNA polymerase sigma factor [Kineosporiaceae bacterium]
MPTPGELIAAAARGEDAAWAELIGRHRHLVRTVCRRHGVVGPGAEDVAQTTWLALFVHIDRIHTPEGIAGWLRTTAARECLSLHRRAAREVLTGEVEPPTEDGSPVEEHVEILRLCELIRRAVAGLGHRERALMELMLQPETPSYAEISRRLGMPLGAIGPVRQRALRHLHQQLAVLDPEVVAVGV